MVIQRRTPRQMQPASDRRGRSFRRWLDSRIIRGACVDVLVYGRGNVTVAERRNGIELMVYVSRTPCTSYLNAPRIQSYTLISPINVGVGILC